MPSLNTKLMDSIPLNLPSREIQDKIAGLLDSIDSRIENNNKVNQELESMAKTIYDYWLLQFEFPNDCLLYTSPSPRDPKTSRMPSSA